MSAKGSDSGCGVVVVIAIIIIAFIITGIKKCNDRNNYENSSLYKELEAEKQRQEDSINHLKELATTNPDEYNRIIREHEEQLRRDKMWKYTIKQDDKTKSDNVWATIKSKNYCTVKLPESMKQKKRASDYKTFGECYITVRYMKKSGSNVILKIPDITYRNTSTKHYVFVWFDEMKQPLKFDYDILSDDNVILKKGKSFIEHCKKATHIRLNIPILLYIKDEELDYEFEIPEPLVWNYK